MRRGQVRSLTNPAILMLVFIGFISLSFRIIGDYGVNWDERHNLDFGIRYLSFFLDRDAEWLDFSRNVTAEKLPDYPPFGDFFSEEIAYSISPLPGILAASSYLIFHKQLGIFDPISAHHLINPLLIAVLGIVMIWFLQRNYSWFVAISSFSTLLFLPRFFGEVYSNIRDIPEIVFYSIWMMLVLEWKQQRKDWTLFGSFVFLGLSLASKPNIFIGIGIFFFWMLLSHWEEIKNNPSIQLSILVKWAIGIGMGATIFFFSFPQASATEWLKSGDAFRFLASHLHHYALIGRNSESTFHLYPFSQLLAATPIVVLILSTIGIIKIVKDKNRPTSLGLLWILWLLIPMARLSLPGANYYDGMRHFLISLVPMSIIAGIGLQFTTEKIQQITKFNNPSLIKSFSLILLLVYLVSTLSATHPYQTSYFNELVGGLGGAQKKDIPFASDYYAISYKEAIEWLNKNANQNGQFATLPNRSLSKVYETRSDLTLIQLEGIGSAALSDLESSSYLVLVPRRAFALGHFSTDMLDVIAYTSENFELVHQVTRQNGVIFNIYQTP